MSILGKEHVGPAVQVARCDSGAFPRRHFPVNAHRRQMERRVGVRPITTS